MGSPEQRNEGATDNKHYTYSTRRGEGDVELDNSLGVLAGP
jgi:hypothetical protein